MLPQQTKSSLLVFNFALFFWHFICLAKIVFIKQKLSMRVLFYAKYEFMSKSACLACLSSSKSIYLNFYLWFFFNYAPSFSWRAIKFVFCFDCKQLTLLAKLMETIDDSGSSGSSKKIK